MPDSAARLPAWVYFLARFFSYLFHPVFIPTYVMAFLLFVHPYAYGGMDARTRGLRLFSVFFTTAFFPIFSVFLLWRLRLFTHSMQLKTSKERIVPYALTMIFYFWMWHVFNNIGDPRASVHFFLGNFAAVCLAWFCNIYFKVSMHSVAAGGLVAFAVLFSFHDNYASGAYLGIAFLVAGILMTARLLVSDHNRFEIYSGFFAGVVAMIVGWVF